MMNGLFYVYPPDTAKGNPVNMVHVRTHVPEDHKGKKLVYTSHTIAFAGVNGGFFEFWYFGENKAARDDELLRLKALLEPTSTHRTMPCSGASAND